MVAENLRANEPEESKDPVNTDKPDEGTRELTVENLREFERELSDISNDPTTKI
jgi:hypothetical protein